MTVVFILCAGNGDRWGQHLGIPKQMVCFGEESLLERTVRLVFSQDDLQVYCVTSDPRIRVPNVALISISPTRSIAETIVSVSDKYHDRNIFLLGDVFYSEQAISRILVNKGSITFFGRPWPSAFVNCGHGEMFGLSFTKQKAAMIRNIVSDSLTIEQGVIDANIWKLYQICAGLPKGSSGLCPEFLTTIDDYTNDIDTPIDYERRKNLYDFISSNGEGCASFIIRNLLLWPKHFIGYLRWILIQKVSPTRRCT